jgi:hypothetical protein
LGCVLAIVPWDKEENGDPIAAAQGMASKMTLGHTLNKAIHHEHRLDFGAILHPEIGILFILFE